MLSSMLMLHGVISRVLAEIAAQTDAGLAHSSPAAMAEPGRPEIQQHGELVAPLDDLLGEAWANSSPHWYFKVPVIGVTERDRKACR